MLHCSTALHCRRRSSRLRTYRVNSHSLFIHTAFLAFIDPELPLSLNHSLPLFHTLPLSSTLSHSVQPLVSHSHRQSVTALKALYTLFKITAQTVSAYGQTGVECRRRCQRSSQLIASKPLNTFADRCLGLSSGNQLGRLRAVLCGTQSVTSNAKLVNHFHLI